MQNDTGSNDQNGYPGWVMPLVQQATQGTSVPPAILLALLQQESGFNPNARSSAGAEGIAQFMPGTAQSYNIDPFNPQQAIQAAAQYLNKYYNQYGNWQQTLAAYNAGPGNVNDWQNIPETNNYVNSILSKVGMNINRNSASPSANLYQGPPQQQQKSASRQPSAQGGNYYTVQPGDTLSKIALAHYGNAQDYTKLSGYSSGNPNLIYPGERIQYG